VYNHRQWLAGGRGAEKNITAQLRDERCYVYMVVVGGEEGGRWRWRWRDGEGMRNDGRRRVPEGMIGVRGKGVVG